MNCLHAGLTQLQLARLANVSQAHIAKIENDRVDPRMSTVNRMLQVLTERRSRRCEEIMTQDVVLAAPQDHTLYVSRIMIKKAISQLPVKGNGQVIGTVTEESIIRNLSVDIAKENVEKIMDPPLPSISKETSIDVVRRLLVDYTAALVMDRGVIVGIITRSDLLEMVSSSI
ncbi:CBS domain-containing protein [Candidatus Bathyarchaeota archaeon]|nr:CBS domain-containing protein [Candidatus Bathyarchaeota archaeon]